MEELEWIFLPEKDKEEIWIVVEEEHHKQPEGSPIQKEENRKEIKTVYDLLVSTPTSAAYLTRFEKRAKESADSFSKKLSILPLPVRNFHPSNDDIIAAFDDIMDTLFRRAPELFHWSITMLLDDTFLEQFQSGGRFSI